MSAASLLVSLSYWENFSQVRYSTNRVVLFVQDQINDLRRHNAKIYLLVSPIKVVLMFTFAYAFIPKSVEEQMSFFSKRVNFTQQFVPGNGAGTNNNNNMEQFRLHHSNGDLFFTHSGFLVPFIIHVVSSMFCYYTARIACKVIFYI